MLPQVEAVTMLSQDVTDQKEEGETWKKNMMEMEEKKWKKKKKKRRGRKSRKEGKSR